MSKVSALVISVRTLVTRLFKSITVFNRKVALIKSSLRLSRASRRECARRAWPGQCARPSCNCLLSDHLGRRSDARTDAIDSTCGASFSASKVQTLNVTKMFGWCSLQSELFRQETGSNRPHVRHRTLYDPEPLSCTHLTKDAMSPMSLRGHTKRHGSPKRQALFEKTESLIYHVRLRDTTPSTVFQRGGGGVPAPMSTETCQSYTRRVLEKTARKR